MARDERAHLQEKLDREVSYYTNLAIWNQRAIFLLWFVSLVASVTAALLIAGQWGNRAAHAIVSVTPAAVQSFLGVFRLQAKVDWHFEAADKLERLADQLRDRAGRVEVISEKRNDVNSEMNKKWPRVGGRIEIKA
jgi:hypothetical protein